MIPMIFQASLYPKRSTSQRSTQLVAPMSSSKSLDINSIPPGVQLFALNMSNSGFPVGLWKSSSENVEQIKKIQTQHIGVR